LKNLEYLEELNINSTDLDAGWEYLPTDELNFFVFGDCERAEAGVKRLKEVLGISEELAVDGEESENFWKVNVIRQMQEERLKSDSAKLK
jgi:hypothetical protein